MPHASITELLPHLATGALTADLLLQTCLAAIADFDAPPGGVGAIRQLAPDAQAVALACDVDRRGGRLRGPLHGIPVIVKDNIDVAGLPTTSGCTALAEAVARRDAPIVARWRAAGAVVVGKANMSEFSFEVRSRSSIGGDVRNPFNRDVTAGGSSGGTAAAVAAGFAVAGLGTDTGGSIRNPAGFNALVGLRPTYGSFDMTGIAPLSPSTDTVGPIARSVDDMALLFAVSGGGEVAPPRSVAGRRVGLLTQFVGDDPDVRAAVARGTAALAGAGVKVETVSLPAAVLPHAGRPHIVDAEFVPAFDAYLAAGFPAGPLPDSVRAIVTGGRYLAEYAEVLATRLEPSGRGPDTLAVVAAHRGALARALSQAMDAQRLDALAYPTSMAVPRSLDRPPSGWAPELAAAAGWPAISVPAGRADDGVPLGLDLLARAGQEELLFDLGRAVERAIGPRPLPFSVV